MRDFDQIEEVSTATWFSPMAANAHVSKAAMLLGDPKFPEILLQSKQREKIERYQGLYRDYSQLGLSQAYDRPAAIEGLQQRLLRTMAVKGGFGILYEDKIQGTLPRSLLWHRGGATPSLSRIKFPESRVSVPSWSWMAYTGEIDYLSLDFGKIEWENIESPWSRSEDSEGNNTLAARAQGYNQEATSKSQINLIFDTPANAEQHKTMCVVLGVQKASIPLGDKRHYVLLVTPTKIPEDNGSTVFERVGVGYLPGKCIVTEPLPANIR